MWIVTSFCVFLKARCWHFVHPNLGGSIDRRWSKATCRTVARTWMRQRKRRNSPLLRRWLLPKCFPPVLFFPAMCQLPPLHQALRTAAQRLPLPRRCQTRAQKRLLTGPSVLSSRTTIRAVTIGLKCTSRDLISEPSLLNASLTWVQRFLWRPSVKLLGY